MPQLRMARGRVSQFSVLWTMTIGVGLLAGKAMTAPTDPATICDAAAASAAEETGVPLDVLRTITRTETGRGGSEGLKPWPWTVNMEGESVWFDTAQQAQVYVFRNFRQGARSFDIGCFQLNYRWHGQAFDSIEEMFDPLTNARYAAQFLKRLHAESGDWTSAVGTYHSRTKENADRYVSRYEEVRDNLPSATEKMGAHRLRREDVPLLKAKFGDKQSHGSLVPPSDSTGAVLLAP